MLKNCAPQLAPAMATIFQASIDTGKLPSDWLNANIAPLYKKGDVHLPENYRPFSLTCVSCRLLEHIICKHILFFFCVCFDHLFYKPLLQLFTMIAQRQLSGCLQFIYISLSFSHSYSHLTLILQQLMY